MPEKTRSVPIGPIRASRPSLIHCWESSSAMARVTCRAQRRDRQHLRGGGDADRGGVDGRRQRRRPGSGSRSAGWSCALREHLPPAAGLLDRGHHADDVLDARPAGRRWPRAPGRRRRSPSPTRRPRAARGAGAARGGPPAGPPRPGRRPRPGRARRGRPGQPAGVPGRAAVRPCRGRRRPMPRTCPSGNGSAPVTTVPTARAPDTAAVLARCSDPEATAPAAPAADRAARVGSPVDDPSSPAVADGGDERERRTGHGEAGGRPHRGAGGLDPAEQIHRRPLHSGSDGRYAARTPPGAPFAVPTIRRGDAAWQQRLRGHNRAWRRPERAQSAAAEPGAPGSDASLAAPASRPGAGPGSCGAPAGTS